MSEGVLTRFEELVAGVLDLLEKKQAENTELKRVIQQLRNDLEELKRENRAKCELIEHLENDRSEIRSRVEKIMKRITALEKPARESSF